MVVVPELGRDEQLLALHDRGDDTLERGPDLLLILVDQRTVDVPVPVADGDLDLHG